LDKKSKEKLVLILREVIFREFKSMYWLTDEEILDIMKEVYDRALLGIT